MLTKRSSRECLQGARHTLHTHSLLYEAIQHQRKIKNIRLRSYKLPRIETANHSCGMILQRINLRSTQP